MGKLLVICAQRYNGHELWTLLGVLLEHDHTFEVVSQKVLIRDELTMQPNTLERTVYKVQVEEVELFDAICIVSGNMQDTEAYWTDTHVGVLLQEFKKQQKIVAAICCSVPTLAPIVSGVKVSFFPLVRARYTLQHHHALLNSISLTVDTRHKVITAENQMLTQLWAEEISNMLEGLPPQYEFVESGFTPKGRPRRMSKEVQLMIDQAKAQKGELS